MNENFKVKYNYRNKCDGLYLLNQIDDSSVKVVFFDPQYRGILDKMRYGNEGKKRGIGRSALTQMTEDTIRDFLSEISRILSPSGYLFLWVDKFHLVEGIASWFNDTKLEPVDLITWDKERIGMGYRTRRKSEYLIIIQKPPRLAKTTWKIHNIPDVWSEKVIKVHAHSKPIELQKQLILATTNESDIVCDPCAGGYSVFEACKQTNRTFIGGDVEYGEDIA